MEFYESLTQNQVQQTEALVKMPVQELRSCAQAIESLDLAMQSIRNRIDRSERMRTVQTCSVK